ncbi:uncharacterized protein [Watersipora subatra]|uniref:uncharacterized protein n=1 Tax=Watersipora subatra TaxID=2589382 RepID=UPI00355B2488
MAEAADEVQAHHVVPACLLEPSPSQFFLQPASPSDSLLSLSGDERVTMTTATGALVTTATTQPRRHSYAIPMQTVTPSRRPSLYDTNPVSTASTNTDRVQTLTQQVLAMNVSFRCHEEQTKEWQTNSSRLLETQLERLAKYEQAILDNQQTILELREKITQQERIQRTQNLNISHYPLAGQLLTLAAVALAAYAFGKLTQPR